MQTQYAINEINEALITLGIDFDGNIKTAPDVMKQIMAEIDLDINDILKTIDSNLLNRLVTEEIPLAPLKERILFGIANNPPIALSLIEASNLVLEDKDYQSTKNLAQGLHQQIKYSLYFTVILETLTYLMVNDKLIEKAVALSLLKKRESINPGSSFWNFWNIYLETKGDLFFALKTISIDPGLFADLCWREYFPTPSEDEIDHFTKKNHLTGLNNTVLKQRLNEEKIGSRHYSLECGNIFAALASEEALVNRKDSFSWFLEKNLKKHPTQSIDNVKAGLALILYQEVFETQFSPRKYINKNIKPKEMPDTSKHTDSNFWNDLYNYSVDDNAVLIQPGMPQEWVNLYEAWNIAFVLRYFPQEFYLTLPKLLIPETSSSSPEMYITNRVTSLWLTINFINALKRNNIKTKCSVVGDNSLLLNILGKNNLEYAQRSLFKSEINLEEFYQEHIQSKTTFSLYIKALKIINGDYLLPEERLKELRNIT